MTTLSTHVLDAALGTPAAGLETALSGPGGESLAVATTDPDGRIRFGVVLPPATYALVLATGPWFAADGRDTFFPQVTVAFEVDPERAHLHVALLLSPYSFTSYRGS